jgi:hypothetical protein
MNRNERPPLAPSRLTVGREVFRLLRHCLRSHRDKRSADLLMTLPNGALSVALIVSCLASIAAQVANNPLKPEWGAVLPETEARRAFGKPRLCNRPAPGPIDSMWIPDDATIRRLETALGPALRNAIQTSTIRGGKPDAADFYRQYAGFLVEGRRIVYINGFHVDAARSFGPAWKTKAVLACDGGMLFSGAEFRLDTGVVEKIIFNGG